MSTWNEKIKELRKLKGWTQQKLAEYLDVSISTVQKWEQGKFMPSKHAAKRLTELGQVDWPEWKAKIKTGD